MCYKDPSSFFLSLRVTVATFSVKIEDHYNKMTSLTSLPRHRLCLSASAAGSSSALQLHSRMGSRGKQRSLAADEFPTLGTRQQRWAAVPTTALSINC